jgi:ribosomal protein S18 acetylase RimI-like enzyme
MFDVQARNDGMSLARRRLAEPLTKRFPLEDLADPARPWNLAWVAEVDGVVRGFAAAGFQAWNRRLVLWHLYVDEPARGRGLARALVDAVETEGRRLGARHLWLETSSLNAPGVEAYRRLGFSLTGVDLTLYDGTPAEGEAALFFSKPLQAP